MPLDPIIITEFLQRLAMWLLYFLVMIIIVIVIDGYVNPYPNRTQFPIVVRDIEPEEKDDIEPKENDDIETEEERIINYFKTG